MSNKTIFYRSLPVWFLPSYMILNSMASQYTLLPVWGLWTTLLPVSFIHFSFVHVLFFYFLTSGFFLGRHVPCHVTPPLFSLADNDVTSFFIGWQPFHCSFSLYICHIMRMVGRNHNTTKQYTSLLMRDFPSFACSSLLIPLNNRHICITIKYWRLIGYLPYRPSWLLSC